MSEEKLARKFIMFFNLDYPSVVKLKNKIINSPEKIFDVELTYITSEVIGMLFLERRCRNQGV